MRYADGVISDHVHPTLWLWLGALGVLHHQATGKDMWITSLWRPFTGTPTKHAPARGDLVEAADIRRWYLDETHFAEPWAIHLRELYGSHLYVLLEPEWLTVEELAARGGREKVQPHIHVQLRSRLLPRPL